MYNKKNKNIQSVLYFICCIFSVIHSLVHHLLVCGNLFCIKQLVAGRLLQSEGEKEKKKLIKDLWSFLWLQRIILITKTLFYVEDVKMAKREKPLSDAPALLIIIRSVMFKQSGGLFL